MQETNWIKIGSWSLAIIIILTVIWVFLPFGTVGAGQRGVVLSFGAVTGEIKSEGLYFRTPFKQKIHIMDVQVQKDEVKASAASKDLQTVSATVAVNYHLDAREVANVYQRVGNDYVSKIISPAVQESIKAATANYTAEELVTKRSIVRDEMEKNLVGKLENSGIIADAFNVIDLDFSPSFNAAIEAKVTAEQNALAAKNKLEQIKFEAQQTIETAKAQAETIRLQSDAANNDKYIQLKQLEVQQKFAEKWNGQLPLNLYGSAPIPFLQLGGQK